ncbi:protocadherin-23 [Dromiciops gliroides]|uniref:protocadherin-23 n=1 Tax=Dromiciops gliroides TaxID=33562 RepID=UPI001CC820A9|nr:protocadherin-23 [Dromiciops gliroides]
MNPPGRRRCKALQQQEIPAGQRLMFPRRRETCRGLQWDALAGAQLRLPAERGSQKQRRGCSGGQLCTLAAGQRYLLGLFLHMWLWTASGSSAQVYNLSLAVDEGLPPDTLVGDILAGLPGEQQGVGDGFFLSEDSGDSPLLDDFHVDTDTGIIRTARSLDRERRDRYSFVAATLLGAVVQVEITVNDVNDHSPRFPSDSLQLDISELSPPGTAFRLPGARDPDAGLFSIQGYTLLQPPELTQNPEGRFFQLRYGGPGQQPSSSGSSSSSSSSPLEPLDLVLVRRLDREAAAAHELTIEAWDGGSPRRTGRLQVEVRVLDENDNPPVFNQSEYRVAVREDAPPGTAVCRVHATDLDLGPNGEVRYSLRTRQPSAGGVDSEGAYFSVEELSGLVRVRRPLDRESQSRHQLVVEARDGGAEPEAASALVSIAVLDVNDNRPSIHLLFLTEGGGAQVSEGARRGDYVARVSVSDLDGDPEGEEAAEVGAGSEGGSAGITLSLEGGVGSFALRPGGPRDVFFLCVEGPLDRESRSHYELLLVATDSGSPPLSTQEALLLRVTDVNDQVPHFSQERYYASVSEAAAPGTAVLRLSASDGDEPGTDQARVRYVLTQVQPPNDCNPEDAARGARCHPLAFAVDPESGVISTTRALDREVQEAVELQVVAQDLGQPPLSSTCWVSVTVEDVNDSEPVFQRQVYNASVAEHAPSGHCFLQVKASDADTGQYGHIEYFLYDGFHSSEKSQEFQIDPHSGHICVSRDIDRERDPATYDLLVKAQDGGGLSAQAFVRVELKDVNDNQPVFNPASYVTSISGHTQPGTEILNVVATDRDAGIYGVVAYELMPGDFSSLFTVDSATGIIYLISTLSHLESTSVFLTVSARDGGGLTSVINADVTIHILQTALAPAIFERSKYAFSIHEDVPEGSPVGTVKAREPLNSLETVSYRISSGDSYGSFTIDPKFGVIRTRKQLDHETQPIVILTIQSQLGSSPVYGSTQVNITVIDVNDNPPIFRMASDEVRLLQSTLPGTALYIAHAEDKDSGQNGFVQYTIENQWSSIFTIDSDTGVIYLSGILGQEIQQGWTLYIRAKDLGVPPLTSLLRLTVTVEKPDLKPPLAFEHLVYQIEISEFLPPTTQILQVWAFSLESHHKTSDIAYSLEPTTESVAFGIDASTGWISLRRQLNYETTQIYNFKVFAWSLEDRLRQNVSTAVTVHVLDENDNCPAFLHDVLFLQVEENPTPQGVIGTIIATDKDSGKNGQLSYFLLSDGKFFKINPNTGEIINWMALDREQQVHHQLIVLVTDHGSPPRNATMITYISITDLNDNKPFFPQFLPGKELKIKVLEGQTADMLVTTVFAKDLDSGNNGEVLYSLSSEDSSEHFKIDANSGEIRTTTPLLYNHRPHYRMTVVASDQGMPSLQGHAVIHIQVIPLSKERPSVSRYIQHLVIPENSKPAKVMSLVKSPDYLQQHDGKLQLSIVAEDKDSHFQIDSSTGDLFLSRELDYEMTSHYLLRVTAKDNSHSPPVNSTIFLSIDVEDQNDHSPSFQDDFIVISIEENVSVGTLVYTFNAKDGDGSFLNSKVQYFIEMNSPGENPFLIHPSYGTLVTASPLDRETIQSLVLTVTASDQAVNVTDRRLGTMTAKVVILDINDHSPSFVSSPIAYIAEDEEIGSLVHHIVAKDPDEGRNGRITYHILSGNENKTFMLDEKSGLLTTIYPLDYETQTFHVLTLLSLDAGLPALSTTQTLTIYVLDVNDEAPEFKQHLYEATVAENQGPGQYVTKVEAVDRDSGINSQLQFEIMPTTISGLFKIDSSTGEVVTAAALDRETQEFFTLRVLVKDQGIPPLSSTTTVICSVKDENDHAPKFIIHNPEIQVPENQEPEVIYTVLAVDMDTDNNGAVRYRIIGGNNEQQFTIDTTSGELSTTCSLDKEHISNFTLIIEGYDLGNPSRSSITELKVTVLDENDHSPTFPTSHYQACVKEDLEVGSVILELSAVDEDSGLNGQVEYFLTNDALGLFTIDRMTGTLRLTQGLDRETRSQYVFRAVASDCNVQSPRRTIVDVTVNVDDVNDNSPVFGQNPLDVFVSSQMSVNQTIATLISYDSDLGLNGVVVFHFAETQSMFHIDEHSGEVRLQTQLSSEHFPVWLQVKAMDQGIPTRTAVGLLVIHMQEKDERFSFSQQLYTSTVTENCETGTSIVTVEAFTPEPNEKDIKYWILSGNENGVFSLNSKTGELTVKEPIFLDFEVINEINLIVLAKSSWHTTHCKLAVLVQDVNDNVPVFQSSTYRASVSEEQPFNTQVMQVFATDLDSELNGQVEYSILSGNQDEAFQIDAVSGMITTNTVLDYELTNSYSLVVQAADKGMPRLSATAIVNIQVVDLNDNIPAFLPSERVEVPESTSLGSVVTRVAARDGDSGPALVFSFTKGGNPGSRFAIDHNTGDVMLTKPLDFEGEHEYELLVEISDSVHHTEAVLVVYVMDVNDNPPLFSQDFYQVTLPEMTPVGSSILTVSATDQDTGTYGRISYKILSSAEGFSIDPQNGSIFTVKPVMLLNKTSTIQLLVEAKDGGIPSLTAITLVEIEIQDVNNHAPHFSTEYYNITVSEDTVIGTTLLTLSAIDHDWTHENTHVEYSLISGNLQNTFHVETHVIPSGSPYKHIGQLVLSHPLDRETMASHELIILASDHGHPPLNSTATILIDVLDANDNAPIFSSPEYHAHVKESLPVGSEIIVVSAKDHDTGANSEVTYTIISGNEKGHFQVDGETGVIDLIKPLDYEDTLMFTLTVQASNRGTNNFAFSVVSISVLDDNDHAPLFVFSSLNCVVPENLPNFSIMCTVHALDFDAGPYGQLTYSIPSSCLMNHGISRDHDLFFIDPLTGDIYAKQILDYETETKHCFIVQAEDKGEAKATLMVQVDVEGIDEYDPIFTQGQYCFSLPEIHHTRQVIGKVEASDADAGVDGLVLYTLATSSTFFSINKTNGDIYWIGEPPFKGSNIMKDGIVEMKVIAHSPKMDSKSSSCTIFVNMSSFPQGDHYILSANSLSISLTASIIIFLLLVISLVALIVRYKRKDTVNSCGEKKVSSSSPSNLSLASDPSILKDSQKAQDGGNSILPMGSVSEWLNLVDMREKKDMVNPCRHSDSSGHCSVEGDTAEDEEIKRINEHPCRKGSGSVLSDRGSRVPDSGVPRDSDQLSCLSGETDVVITTETLESSFTFEGVGERCDAIYAQNKVLSQPLHKMGMKEKTLMEDSGRDYIFMSNDQDSRYGSLTTLEAPTKDPRSSYDWDYLLNWEPQFQPLSSVFNDIAKLKDEHLQVPGLPQGKKSFVFPPPLITSVAQPGIKAVPPRMPSLPPGKAFKKYPRSPLHQHLHYPPAAMTPSFSPSLSLLTMQSPAMSPLLPDAGLLGTCLVRTAHGPRAEEEVRL